MWQAVKREGSQNERGTASDLPVPRALVFPPSFHFGRLPRKLPRFPKVTSSPATFSSVYYQLNVFSYRILVLSWYWLALYDELFVGGLLPLPVLASPGAVPKTEPVVLSAVRILKTRMRCRLGSAEWEQIIRSQNTWSYWYKNSFGVEGFVTAYTLRKNHSRLVFTSA